MAADDQRWNRLMYYALTIAPAFSPIMYKYHPVEDKAGCHQFYVKGWDFHFDPDFTDGELALAIVHMADHYYTKHHSTRATGKVMAAWHDAACIEVVMRWDEWKDKDHVATRLEKAGGAKWIDGSDLRDHHDIHDREIAEAYYDKILNNLDGQGNDGTGDLDSPLASGNPCRMDASEIPSDEAESEELIQSVDMLRNQLAGSDEGDVFREIKPKKDRPIPWQSKLKKKLSSLRGYNDFSMMPRPKVYPHIKGGGFMSRLQKGLPSMLVVIDASGSMDQELLNECFGICRSTLRQGARPMVAAGDTELTFLGSYQKALVPNAIKAGGGTDMGHVVWKAFKSCREKPQAIILITDGHTPWPEKMPPNFINCIINDYDVAVPDYLKGVTIRVRPHSIELNERGF